MDSTKIEILYTEPHPELKNDLIISDVTQYESETTNFNVPGVTCKNGSESNKNNNMLKEIATPPSAESVQQPGPGSIPMSAILPPLTYDLNNKLIEQGVLKVQAKLIYHWGMYLWQMTAGQPSKRDYHNLSCSIVQAYPALKGGAYENSIVRSQLGTWIRNHRVILKHQQTVTAQKRNSEGEFIKPATSLAKLVPCEKSELPKFACSDS
ncbi:uncharacterized protein LOC123301390 [Chrysoperla carnea]|uniref:uncharacterized protein LOC123301390 n=1 Tax=Chrysoperla carnea TaxID=189513 RepID=UPI001D079E6B|nr:uncharacterized protein LOC123301390 [Chrysoperla carnea]